MDLRIPYTLYPLLLPHSIAWMFLLIALLGGIVAGIIRGRTQGWLSGARAALIWGSVFLVATMIAAMPITFLFYDR